MNTPLRLGTCSYVLCVLWLAAISGCGGDASGGPATSDGAILGRIPANHRASDIQCAQPAAAGTCPGNMCPASLCSSDGGCADSGGSGDCFTSPFGSSSTCSSDSDCINAGANARCVAWLGPNGCSCTSDLCMGDSDCPSGTTCACHGSPYKFGEGNFCEPGNCKVDADCGMGGYCSPTPALPCNMNGRDLFCQGLGYYCHTPKDECVDDSDCQGVGFPGCVYDPSARHWKCEVYAQPG
jgi:hypothetical protein